MCRNDHCLEYVITSEWFVVHVWPRHNLGMWCLYFSLLSCDRDMRNLMRLLSTLALWCRYYAYILSGSFFNSAETERTWEAKPRVRDVFRLHDVFRLQGRWFQMKPPGKFRDTERSSCRVVVGTRQGLGGHGQNRHTKLSLGGVACWPADNMSRNQTVPFPS